MDVIEVIKRNGTKELLDINKIHVVLEWAVDGLKNVSVSDIEMNASLQFKNGIRTSAIHQILIKSAADLISEDAPNYQYVAARLLNFNLRKEVFGDYLTPHLKDVVKSNVSAGVYDSLISSMYTEDEFNELNSYMNHDRDDLFSFAGIQQVIDKYLVRDRTTGKIFETPQYMYMLIAMIIFQKYKDNRLQYVKDYYDAISTFKINIPTPIMAGVRTPVYQYSSCTLIDVGDSIDSIFTSAMAVGKYTANRAGIGLNIGRIRSIGSRIRGGEVIHTGVIPFLKVFEASVKSCTQNGLRGGSATVNFPFWHHEIEDVIVLKNNKGSEDNRVRKLDYCIQLSKLFYERVLADEKITLFSPGDVPELYDAFGTKDFDELYKNLEKNRHGIRKVRINARNLFVSIIKERIETGRIYIMNLDHANSHSSFLDQITMTNLCVEITLPVKPLNHIDDQNAEIALCILSATNVGAIKDLSELEHISNLQVRALDELIDLQDYPVEAAKISTLNRRSLGIGYIGLANFLAKHKVKYDDKDAWKFVHDLSEAHQFYLIKASMEIAKEKGACGGFANTKYSQGILPIDTYKKEVDGIVPNVLNLDWETLRQDVLKYGMRNSTLSAQMPAESSAVVSNQTNGIEPPRSAMSVKKSKQGTLKQLVPDYDKYKAYYTYAWDMDSNTGYMNICAVMQKFFDQSISANQYYDYLKYPNGELPVSVVMKDLIYGYKMGMKTFYYLNTTDNKSDGDASDPSCESGACAI